MLDGYEASEARAWELGIFQGVAVDHLSASVVNLAHPYLYPRQKEGYVLSPRVPLRCAFSADAASGTDPVDRICGDRWELAMLAPTLAATSTFNELIYSKVDLEKLGPAVHVEAFLYCGDDGTRARRLWRAYLAAVPPPRRANRDVPLLRVHALAGRWTDFAVGWFEQVGDSTREDS